MKITEEHKKVLEWMSGDHCYFYPSLSDKTELSIKRLKEIMLELKIAGYCTWEQVVNDDWMYCGSGHILTTEGVQLKQELGIENKYHDDEIYY